MDELYQTMSAAEMCDWIVFLNIEAETKRDAENDLDDRARKMQGL